jgi:cobalt-zinc-cadmium resistance protein CzcA
MKVPFTIVFILVASLMSHAQSALTEEALIAHALQHYELFAKQDLEMTASELRQREAWKLPPAEINGQYGQFNSNVYDPMLELRQSFGSPVEMIRKSQRLKEETRLQGIEQELEKADYLKELRFLFANWSYFFALENIYLEQEKALEAFAQIASLRNELGESGGSEVLLAQTKKRQVELQRNTNQSRRIGLSKILSAYTGLDMGNYIPENWPAAVPESIDAVLIQQKGSHPAVNIAQQQAVVWEKRQRESQAAISPSFFAGYFRQRITDPSVLFEGLQGFQIGLRFPLIYGAYKANADADQAMQQGAVIAMTLAQRQMEAGKQSLYSELKAHQHAIKQYMESILPDQKALEEIALAQFQQGSLSYVEYVQIQNMRFEAEITYANMLLDAAKLLSQYRIYQTEFK